LQIFVRLFKVLYYATINEVKQADLLAEYEYSNKVSIVSTKDTNIIVGVASHDKNIHDSKTLDAAITHANSNRTSGLCLWQ
jgi:hypothetical protein